MKHSEFISLNSTKKKYKVFVTCEKHLQAEENLQLICQVKKDDFNCSRL